VSCCLAVCSYGTGTGSTPCHICPAGTYSAGGQLSPCRLCPNEWTSDRGATSVDKCYTNSVKCGDGAIAPVHAASEEECGCKPGFGRKSRMLTAAEVL